MKKEQTIAQFLNVKKFKNCELPTHAKAMNGFYDPLYKIYLEESNNYWYKREYDSNDNEIYYEDSYGLIVDNRKTPCTPKTVIIDGKEYELKEVK